MLDKAGYIWRADRTTAFNGHLLLRRSFALAGPPVSGALELSASDKYRLWINGTYVDEGPARSDRGMCYVDRYPAAELPLRAGRNVIAVLALNKNLAEHGQPPKSAAFIAALRVELEHGKPYELFTDEAKRMGGVHCSCKSPGGGRTHLSRPSCRAG